MEKWKKELVTSLSVKELGFYAPHAGKEISSGRSRWTWIVQAQLSILPLNTDLHCLERDEPFRCSIFKWKEGNLVFVKHCWGELVKLEISVHIVLKTVDEYSTSLIFCRKWNIPVCVTRYEELGFSILPPILRELRRHGDKKILSYWRNNVNALQFVELTSYITWVAEMLCICWPFKFEIGIECER